MAALPARLIAFVSLLLTALPALGASPTKPPPATPASLPGAVTYVYRAGRPEPMRLFVFRPAGWTAHDRRPALLHFFGGGFLHGTPLQSVGQATAAAKLGLVGIAADYRTHERFGTNGAACVADGRAALHWIQVHADELGIDPARIVVSGSSAGGHVALWTAIGRTPWGSDPAEAPLRKPAALILMSAAADTSVALGQRADRFAGHGDELSPQQNLDAKMPPVLMFHGDADEVVPYHYAAALDARLRATGNACELVTIPGGGHGITGEEWKRKARDRQRQFLADLHLLP